MRRSRFLVWRAAWAVFVVWLLLTVTFLVVDWAPNWYLAGSQVELDPSASGQEVAASPEGPLLDRYLDWMIGFATLDWGWSTTYERPVAAVIGMALPVTLAYVLPALALSAVLGVVLGLYSRVGRDGAGRYARNAAVYSGLAVPAFFLGEMALFAAQAWFGWAPAYAAGEGVFAPGNLAALVLPALVMTVNLTAIQARYTHAEAGEYVVADFAKTIRAGGGGPISIARHALRNALVPILSLLVTRALSILLLSMYVLEFVFDLPGLGLLTIQAVRLRDVGVILAVVFLTVLVGVLGNLLQDVAYEVLDPRVDRGD